MQKNQIQEICFYDIEILPLKYLSYPSSRPQYMSHSQLYPNKQLQAFICIQYAFREGGVKILWADPFNSEQIIKEFDKVIQETLDNGGIIIGKNSNNFDNKHVNAHRLFNDLPSMPDWIKYTDDLQVQFKQHFNLPSQTLDYISTMFDLGGKVKMQWADWVAIYRLMEYRINEPYIKLSKLDDWARSNHNMTANQIISAGNAAYNKFDKYGAKDVLDLRKLWFKCEKHLTPKTGNHVLFRNGPPCCPHCGSTELKKDGTRKTTVSILQRFKCKNSKCAYFKCYCGSATIRKDGTFGIVKKTMPR